MVSASFCGTVVKTWTKPKAMNVSKRTGPRKHDESTQKRYVSHFHYGMVHKPIAVQGAMKKSRCQSHTIDKEWDNKLKN